LISRSYASRSCERCASELRTRPNHFPLPFLRHGLDFLGWRFTTFDLDQIFQVRSRRHPVETMPTIESMVSSSQEGLGCFPCFIDLVGWLIRNSTFRKVERSQAQGVKVEAPSSSCLEPRERPLQ
jgi:hypothetical protein